jgi:hypothetical protein
MQQDVAHEDVVEDRARREGLLELVYRGKDPFCAGLKHLMAEGVRFQEKESVDQVEGLWAGEFLTEGIRHEGGRPQASGRKFRDLGRGLERKPVEHGKGRELDRGNPGSPGFKEEGVEAGG